MDTLDSWQNPTIIPVKSGTHKTSEAKIKFWLIQSVTMQQATFGFRQFVTYTVKRKINQRCQLPWSLSYTPKRTSLKQKGPNDCNVSYELPCCWGAPSRLQLHSFILCNFIGGRVMAENPRPHPRGDREASGRSPLIPFCFRRITSHFSKTHISGSLSQLLPTWIPARKSGDMVELFPYSSLACEIRLSYCKKLIANL